MAQVLVVADDLTGANATGARFARAGMRVATVAPRHARRAAAEFDAVVVDLDSRHLPADEAAALVGEVIAAAGPVPLVVMRTDTTLRGRSEERRGGEGWRRRWEPRPRADVE